MAQRMEIQLFDDVDGTAATQTVRFAMDGRDFEVDLNDKNAPKLRKALTLLTFSGTGTKIWILVGVEVL
jgi:hypothetical protein